MSKEDVVPTAYKYAWTNDSDLSLQNFLTKFRPSMVQNDGTKPWIWVHGSEPSKQDTGVEKAREEAANILKEVTDKVEGIKNDDSIPLRSNKKTGAKSKKEVREQIQADASQTLKEISQKHGYLTGKWLMFAPAEKVDLIWSGIATSLVSGPLNSSNAFLAKVSTSSESDNPGGQQHLICVYIPDVYDKTSVTEVMKILLRNHGVNLSGVKSDLYTTIGLDSKHASGIPSTVWKNSAILPEKEIKELKDAFFAELGSKKTEPVASGSNPAEEPSSHSGDGKVVTQPSKKLKLKKKGQDDPFASDNEDEDDGPNKLPASKAKIASALTKRIRKLDDQEETGERSKKKKTVK